jgi:hypothetical protein
MCEDLREAYLTGGKLPPRRVPDQYSPREPREAAERLRTCKPWGHACPTTNLLPLCAARRFRVLAAAVPRGATHGLRAVPLGAGQAGRPIPPREGARSWLRLRRGVRRARGGVKNARQAQCRTGAEGGPFETGLRERVSNSCKLPRSNGRGGERYGKGARKSRPVRDRETNAGEPPMRPRNTSGGINTEAPPALRAEHGGNLVAGYAAHGVWQPVAQAPGRAISRDGPRNPEIPPRGS